MCDILSKNTQNTENMQFQESQVKKARTHNKKRNRKARMVKYYIENPQYLDPINEEEICFSEEDSGYLSTSTSLSEENQTSKSPTCFDFEKLQICLQKCQQQQQQKQQPPLRNINSLACGFAKHDDPSISIDPEIYCHKTSVTNFGEDAALIERYNDFEVFGVSDGVGGWNRYGVSPAKFSNALLSSVAEITSRSTESFSVNNPVDLLSQAYDNLNEMNSQITDNSDKITGGATACLAVFDKVSSKLYTSNLGDSGFLVIRDLKIVHKSTPQCHHFNSPYQLSILPDEINQKLESLQSLQQNLTQSNPSNSNLNSDLVQNVQNIQNPYYQDTPEKSTFQEFQCQENDIILLASDGLFDNVHHDQIIVLLRHLGVTQDNLSTLNSEEKNQLLQKITTTFVAFARMNGYNKNFISPFSLEAKKQGVKNIIGGKVDDIAILFSVVGGLS